MAWLLCVCMWGMCSKCNCFLFLLLLCPEFIIICYKTFVSWINLVFVGRGTGIVWFEQIHTNTEVIMNHELKERSTTHTHTQHSQNHTWMKIDKDQEINNVLTTSLLEELETFSVLIYCIPLPLIHVYTFVINITFAQLWTFTQLPTLYSNSTRTHS